MNSKQKRSKKDSQLTKNQIEKLGAMLAKGISTVITQKQFKSFDVKEAIEVISDILAMKEHYYDYHEDLLKKHQKNFEYSKRYFKGMTKNGDKAVKGIIKILESYDADPLISLYEFLKQLPKRSCCIHIFKRIVAEANKHWGSPSYFVTNVINGTKQELVSRRTKAYKHIASAVRKVKAKFGKENRHLSLDGVVSVRDGDHYIAFVSGGNNGESNWRAYFDSFMMILEECKRAWIIDIDNDCCDDVHYALIGFRISNKTKTRKEN